MEVSVRDARHDDLKEVSAFATDTWDGWDYVPDVWEDWLDEGVTLVVEDEGSVVGVLHAVTRDDEAWLEGLRVAEGARRRGVATSLVEEVLERLGDTDAEVARGMVFENNEPAVELFGSLGFERATTIHHARGFGFPYGSQIEEANYDDSLDALRDTDAFDAVDGLYATTDWRMWSAPSSPDEYDGDILGFVEDGDVRAIALCDGVRVNDAGEERRTELVLGLVWCQPEYASQFALDVRGEARDRNLNDALVFLPTKGDYTTSFDQSGFDISEGDHVYEKVIR